MTPLAATQPVNTQDRLNSLLTLARTRGASDLMLSTHQPAMLRIDGSWRGHDEPLTAKQIDAFVTTILQISGTSTTGRIQDVDTAFKAHDNTRVRVNIFRTQDEIAIVLRLIPDTLPSLTQLGLPDTLSQIAVTATSGLILVTGATGHGKSTTIAALINEINKNRELHVITLEDPIEYQHHNQKSVIHQRQIGVDTPSFHAGLRSALRQSPDVLVIGELRDLDAMSAAITAAETGHLVLGTLHTSGTEDTINRLIDSFPAAQQNQLRQQLSHNLTAIVSQALIPQIGGGRVLAHELMINTAAISNLIRDARTNQISTAIQSGRNHGMTLLEQSLAQLLSKNRITHTSAYAHAKSKETLDALLEAKPK